MKTLLDILTAIVYFIVSLLIIFVIGIAYLFSVVVILIDELINYIRHKLQ
jgi:hypothetical protein